MNEKDFKEILPISMLFPCENHNMNNNHFKRFVGLLTTAQKRRLTKKYKEYLKALT